MNRLADTKQSRIEIALHPAQWGNILEILQLSLKVIDGYGHADPNFDVHTVAGVDQCPGHFLFGDFEDAFFEVKLSAYVLTGIFECAIACRSEATERDAQQGGFVKTHSNDVCGSGAGTDDEVGF